MCKRKEFFVWKKKGVSIMVSYVLLVVFVIIIGAIVYQWLKSYVPTSALECPDGVSLFIKNAEFDSPTRQLIVTLKNNGLFNLTGYFIHATNSSDQELPIIDLSGYLNEAESPGTKLGNSVLFFVSPENIFNSNSEESYFFDIPSEIGAPILIRITPTRYQDVDERERFVSCSNARTTQIVGEPCVPNSDVCLNRECGIWANGTCGEVTCGNVDCEVPGKVCDGSGTCVDEADCTETCDSEGWQCGTVCGEDCGPCLDSSPFCDEMKQCVECRIDNDCDPGLSCETGQCVYITSCEPDWNACIGLECGDVANGTCETGNCGWCIGSEICSAGQCTLTGNGDCDPGETCADADCEGEQAEECGPGETCEGGICIFNAGGEFNSCGDYCALFGYSFIYACQDTPQKCVPPQGPEGGIYIGDVEGADATIGDEFCLGDQYCCCRPI